MIKTAIRDIKDTELCLYETQKESKCYSYDTLTYLHETYPDTDFVMFVGSDMLLSFDKWFKADELAKLTQLKADGILTEEEFLAQKSKLLKL